MLHLFSSFAVYPQTLKQMIQNFPFSLTVYSKLFMNALVTICRLLCHVAASVTFESVNFSMRKWLDNWITGQGQKCFGVSQRDGKTHTERERNLHVSITSVFPRTIVLFHHPDISHVATACRCSRLQKLITCSWLFSISLFHSISLWHTGHMRPFHPTFIP